MNPYKFSVQCIKKKPITINLKKKIKKIFVEKKYYMAMAD